MALRKHFCIILFSLLLHLELSTQHLVENEELNLENLLDSKSSAKYVKNITILSKPSISPCENFYGFVCGRENASDAYDMTWTSWSEHLHEKYMEWLQGEITPSDELILGKIRKEYKMCMESANHSTEILDYLLSIVDGDIGWPMITTLWGEPASLPVLPTQKYESSLFSLNVKNAQIHIDLNKFSPYGVITGTSSYEEKELSITQRDTYKNEIVKIIQIIAGHKNLDLPINQINDDIDDVMNFRAHLQTIIRKTRKRIKKNRSSFTTVKILETTLQPLKSSAIKFDWHRSFDNLFKHVDNFVVHEDTPVYTDVPALRELVHFMYTNAPRTIVNHIRLHMFESYMRYTTKELNQIYHIIARNLNYTHYPRSRSRMCREEPHFSRALQYQYLEHEFPESFRRAGKIMVSKFKDSMSRQIRNSRLTNMTQMAGVFVLDSIKVIIGVEDKYSNLDKVTSYYQYPSAENYLETLLNARHRIKDIEYSSIGTSNDDVLGESFKSQTKLIRKPRDRLIMIPLGYMHENNLSPKTPAILSYASLGRIISALLNQFFFFLGFDILMFKEKMDQHTWSRWYRDEYTTQGVPLYNCFKQQYDEPSDPSSLTSFYDSNVMRYNMYDQMTALTAYETYKKVIAENEVEHEFVHKNRLDDKFFFKALGNKFCKNHGWMEEYYVENSRSTEYQSKRDRLNRMLSNLPDFGRTFDCALGTPMNPVRKCSFWIP